MFSLVTRSPTLPSSAMRLGARPVAPSRMRVSGLSANSIKSHATSGTPRTYRCIRLALSTRQIIALLSSRRFSWKILRTASSLLASHPIPHIVSVGYRMRPPCLNVCTAVCMSSQFVSASCLCLVFAPQRYSFFNDYSQERTHLLNKSEEKQEGRNELSARVMHIPQKLYTFAHKLQQTDKHGITTSSFQNRYRPVQ